MKIIKKKYLFIISIVAIAFIATGISWLYIQDSGTADTKNHPESTQQAREEQPVQHKDTTYKGPPCAKVSAGVIPVSQANGKVTREKVNKQNLSMKEAMFYKKIGNTGRVACGLCPHACVLDEGEVGRCRVRANVEGKLRSLVYARPITMHLDPIEKKPFFHFHPKEKTLSIATAGCNMRCRNCQNWQISQLSPFKMDNVVRKGPEEIVNIARRKGANIISYTYNDPIVFYEYMLETAKIAHQHGIKNTLVTAAHINEKPVKKLSKYLDAATVDIKGMSNDFYQEFNTGQLDPVLKAIKIMHEEDVWLEISYLVISDENDSQADFRKFSNWVIDNIGANTPVHFLRFFPHYKMKSKPATPKSTLKRARKTAKNKGLNHVYIGNVRDTESEDTFCPHCHKKVIDRYGYRIGEIHITEGNCDYCGKAINGIWD